MISPPSLFCSSHHLPPHCQLDPEGLSCACSCLAHMAQAFPSVLSNLTYAPGFIDLIMRYVALFVNDALLETSSPHHSAQLLSLACLTEVISLAATDCISSPLEDSTSHPGSSGTIFSSYAGDQQRAFSSNTSRISPSLGGNSSNSLQSNRTANSSFLGHLVEMPGVTDLICTCASLHNLDEQAARSATSRLLRKSLSRFARFASDLRALVRQGAQQGDQVQMELGPEDEEHVAYIEPALHAARLHAVVTLRCIAVHWARKMRRDIQSQLDLTEEISDLLIYENRNPIMSTWPQRPATGLKPPTPLHSTQVSFLAQSLRSRVMEASSLAGDTVSAMPGSPKASSQLLLPSLPIVSLLPSARYVSSSGIMSPSNKYYVLGSPTHRGRVPERPARESMKLKELAQLLDHLVALLSINVCGATLEARTEAALTAASNQLNQLNRLDSTKSQETKLVWSAETVSVATSLMCLLSTNQWVGPRIASHSALAEALDSVLEEETYLQVRAMSTTFPTRWRGQFQRTALLDSDDLSLSDCNDLPLAHKDLQVCAMELVSTLANQFASHSLKAGNRFVGPRLSLLLTIDRLLLQASQASGGPSSTTDSSSGGTPRPTQHSLETTGLCLQTLIAVFHCGGMDALLSAPPCSTSSVATSLSNSIFKSLVLYLRHPEPGLRLKAVGVVAAAAQHLTDEKLPTLGAVEGLVYALLDVMQSANDVLFRSLRSSSNTLSSAVSMTASGAFSVDQLPDSSVLEAYQNQLLWGLAAAAALARCPQIAARLVSLKALPAVLRTALRCRVGDVPIYAAGLTGNLCNHLACQPVVASSRGLAQELIRQGREASTFEHLAVVLGAVRNFACNERGRQELSGEPGTVPLLCKLLIREWPANLAAAAPFMSEDLSNEMSMLVSAALCNLSGDVVGLEALLMEQDAVLSAVTSILKDLVPVSLLSSGIIQAPHGGPVHGCGKLSCAWCTGKCKAAGMRPEIVSRVRCFNAVTLANITSHPVMVRNVLVSSGEVARLCMLMLMTLPTPSTQALCEDPLACFRSGTQRMASVSILITLKNLLLALRHPEAPSAWRRHQSALAPSLHRRDSTASAAEDGTQSMTSAHPPPPPAKEQLGGVSRPFSPIRHVKNSRIRGLTASQAASVTPASALDVLDQAISPGSSTGGTGLSLLFDQVVDLLSWVDFTAAADVYAVNPCSTFGADVAGASAAVLSMFAVHGLPERYPKYTETALQCLIRILILPTLLPEPPASYHSSSSDTAAALEVSASHSAMALWALVSNPECTSWGEKLASNVTSLRVLLAAVKKGQRRGGTKARFAGSRMMSALTLGQLVVQGLVEPSFLHRLLDPDSGIMSSLVDLIPLALPQFRRSLGPVTRYKHNQGGYQARGIGGTVPQQGKGQQAGPGGGSGRINAIYTSGPWDAVLDMLGVSSGDMRYAMGLQAAGALAHLLSCKCPDASVTPSLDMSVILPMLEALLSCSEEEVLLSTVMLISSLASSGLRWHCGNLIKSEWLMIKVIEVCATSIEYGALSSGHRLSNGGGRSKSSTSERSKILLILKSQAYAAVALGNLVLPEEDGNGKMRVVQKDCVDALAQLMLTPLTGLPVASADKELAQIQLSVAVAAAAALRNVTSCISEADIASEGDGRLMGSVLALLSGIKQMLYRYETDLALLGAVEQLLQYLFGIIANLAALTECKGRLLKERSLVSVLTIALEAKGTSSLGGGFHKDFALQLAALAAISNLLLASDRPGGQGSLVVIIDQSEPSLSAANDPMVDVRSTAQLTTPTTKRSTTQNLQADGPFPEDNSFKQRTKEMLGVGISYYHQRTDHLKGEACQKSDISHPSESSSSSSEAAHMSLSELHSIVGDEFQMLRMDTRSSGGLIPEEVGLQDLLNGLKVDVGVAVGVGLSSGTMDDEVPEEEEALLASGSQHKSGQGVDREPLRVLQRGFLTALDMGMSHQVRQTLQHLGHSDMVPEEYQHMALWIQTLLLH
ncbi:hypothetical protein CEUSTIGMA_g7196.t1 [Chlamydomonas eustigma]|uniref:Uncharacterized protein n=1 Tax=Chlamydomonas eustigma TaxID=1157962 RepID=A0A250X9I3_9CHLO|nr:hypothetical protein CEUSTIGMA_g7196.t1 [Chlamydomonas eustigma]|eukprot:GAX79755.1 hypothetical protein CEUSTIGMA_g7196.t1 [Chlamydomonas eustigma]